MANSVDPDPIGAVCSGSMLFASILNLSVMLGNYLQQTTFSDVFFLGALRVNPDVLPHLTCFGVLLAVFPDQNSFVNSSSPSL